MATMQNYFEFSQLSMAAYANLSSDLNNQNRRSDYVTALRDADFSIAQAQQFADTYTILDQLPDKPQSGFSATVFKRTDGIEEEYIFAIRGSRPVAELFEGSGVFNEDVLNDWLDTNSGDIVGKGIAISQAVDMFNYIQVLTAIQGESLIQYQYNPEVVDPQTGLVIQEESVTTTTSIASENGILLGKKITVTGHSTGGHLAAIMSRLLPDNIDATYTYAAPGFDTDWTGIGIQTDPSSELFFQLMHDAEVAATGVSQIITIADGGFNSPALSPVNVIEVPGDQALIGNKPATQVEIFSEGEGKGLAENHSIREISDALAVYQLFENLTDSVGSKTIRNVLLASSNEQAGTLEATVNALGDLLGAGTPVTVGNRDELYTRVQAIKAVLINNPFDLTVTSLTVMEEGKLVAMDSNTLASNALTSIAYRYALQHLTPFVVEASSSIETDQFYVPHNNNFVLDLAIFSDNYISDRAEFLVAHIKRNLADIADDEAVPGSISDKYFEDKELGITIIPANNDQLTERVIFGLNDTLIQENLTGGDREDGLYGNDGNDVIFGGLGSDHLEGGEGDDQLFHSDASLTEDNLLAQLNPHDTLNGGLGDDIYYVGRGDVIEDPDPDDRSGQVYFKGIDIFGDYEQQSGNLFIRTTEPGLTLIIEGRDALIFQDANNQKDFFTIKNFLDETGNRTDGEYGISLDIPTPHEPTQVYTNPAGTTDFTIRETNLVDGGTVISVPYEKAVGNDDTVFLGATGSLGNLIYHEIIDVERSPGFKVEGGAGNDWIRVDMNYTPFIAGQTYTPAAGGPGGYYLLYGESKSFDSCRARMYAH